ncbi:MAG: hypothetical protein COW00_08435 [Bdellovibrio sp. CG12_big_fil_rev_8_21_14_0_65_39_13]|nr:MAG: hypothetical protein COW78_14145 [Bdellovibrio sp. CG22_combo_CG10-13_8_21_14_all_39_27]PIQ59857.1 MAG: hypothetical protein COW00_08435 [Bdellovibrio sp. CG12_big_fil_rev_8_21_14_0_65_39_13]PIR34146.1 MAG: hypothetical protein COV37_13630 [Bdellovibrio sp. CG11_big_fil_rev_8_21_14_0_20_39_38]
MPKLPEIETIHRQIEDYLPVKIENVFHPPVSDSLFHPTVKLFNPKGHVIESIECKGEQATNLDPAHLH